MERRTRDLLESAGVLMASLTGGLHLMIGIERLTLYLLASRPFTDIRQPLFVLSGVAIFLGVTLWYRGLRRDAVYAAGILLTLGYIVGWLLLGGHGSNYAWEAGGHHAANPLITLLEHLTGDVYLLATKVTETTLLAVLVALLYDELTRDDADESDDASADDANPT
ncbi:hypothetical protein BRD03_08470 [Halobacteriales archaeon QS_9_68_17]|nr:MAG: hypothetical protein BRD03_08470 [Halobacteriales archaeon QS_9_68_17]